MRILLRIVRWLKGSEVLSLGIIVLLASFFGIYQHNWYLAKDLNLQREVSYLWRHGQEVKMNKLRDVQDVSKGLSRLRSLGFRPDYILDVGANVGEWSRIFRSIFPESKVTMIEGSDSCVAPLMDTGNKFAIALVGAANKYINFYETDKGTGNSIYREKTRNFAHILPKRKKVYTLDTLMAGQPDIQLLKLDIQGAEYDALLGATSLLKTVEVIVLEAGLVGYNEGAPLALETLELLNVLGYDLLDIFGFVVHDTDRFKVMMQVDFIVAKKGSDLFRRRKEQEDKAKVV